MTKPLYHGQYNWQGEIIQLWTHAENPMAAERNFIARLSKLISISGYRLRCYFSGHKDNFKVIEKKEGDIDCITG